MSRSRISPPRTVRLAALVAACAIGAAGCGSGSGGAPTTDPSTSFARSIDAQTTASGSPDKLTVRVAYIGDYSLDEASALVAPGYQGASLAAKAATAAETLPVNLEVVSYTTDGDPQKALEVAGEIAADPQIVGVIIAPFTLESKAVGQVLDAAGLATVSLSSMDPTLSANGWANWRRLVATGAIQARALASFAGRLPAAQKGVCLSGDNSARSLALERVAASQLRGRVAGRVTLAASDVAATQAASAVRRTGCGVVLWTGSGAQAAALRLRLSASKHPVALVATDDTKTDAYLAETGRAGDGTVVACSCVDLTTCAKKRKLHRDTLERFRNLVASGLWPVPTSYYVFKSYRDGPQGRGYSRGFN